MSAVEVVTFGLLSSVAFVWFLTNVSGPHICPIFRVLDPELTKRWSRTKEKRCSVTIQKLHPLDPEDGTNIGPVTLVDPEDGMNIRSRNVGQEPKKKRRWITTQKLQPHTATLSEASNHTSQLLQGEVKVRSGDVWQIEV